MLNYNREIIDVEFDGMSTFVVDATWGDTLESLTDDELDTLNTDAPELVHEFFMDYMY